MIKELISEAAVYEQLAEEAAELAQAASKCARILRGENPTPVSWGEAHRNLIEEFTDVKVCGNELDLVVDMELYSTKIKRWQHRIMEKQVKE